MINTIIFDLDGVLIDAREWHYIALNKALMDACGVSISRDEHISKYDGRPTKKKLELLASEGRIKEEKFTAIFNLKQHYTLMMIRDYCKPDPIKIAMMNSLRGYKKACVTNSIAKTAYEMLVLSGLNYYLDYVQGNEATLFPKPNPSPYLKAMSELGAIPDTVLIVEDSPCGLTAAHRSGAHVLEVDYQSCNADTVLSCLEGLK